MKLCSSCKLEKNYLEFNKNKNSIDGLYHRCRSCHKKYNAIWYEKNREKNIKRNREWKQNNKDKVNKNRREYLNNRYSKDVEFKLTCNLRSRINAAIRAGSKAGSAINDLGCSVVHFKQYLEKQFDCGMDWDNYGNGDRMWNIDHIKPLSRYDLNNRKELTEACHYSNMRPMWSVENSRKNDDWS